MNTWSSKCDFIIVLRYNWYKIIVNLLAKLTFLTRLFYIVLLTDFIAFLCRSSLVSIKHGFHVISSFFLRNTCLYLIFVSFGNSGLTSTQNEKDLVELRAWWGSYGKTTKVHSINQYNANWHNLWNITSHFFHNNYFLRRLINHLAL